MSQGVLISVEKVVAILGYTGFLYMATLIFVPKMH
jgi:hypothetical protein